MKTQIVHISKLQTAKVMTVLYLVISIPMMLFAIVPSLLTHQPIPWGMLWWMPLMYAVFGFIFTFLAPGSTTAWPAGSAASNSRSPSAGKNEPPETPDLLGRR